MSEIAGHSKHISEEKFIEYYLKNIDIACKRVKSGFSTDIAELINDNTNDSDYGTLGTNMPDLIFLLKEI